MCLCRSMGSSNLFHLHVCVKLTWYLFVPVVASMGHYKEQHRKFIDEQLSSFVAVLLLANYFTLGENSHQVFPSSLLCFCTCMLIRLATGLGNGNVGRILAVNSWTRSLP